jgi:LmbE family N-acetylglucosaminyl deacetylase
LPLLGLPVQRGLFLGGFAAGGGEFRPDALLTASPELTVGMGRGRRFLSQADHRVVGLAVLDAARDAGNRWIFPELPDKDLKPWAGATDVCLMGALEPTHAVDVTHTLPAGIDSLRAHRAYLDGLGRDFDPDQFLRAVTAGAGQALGVQHPIALGPSNSRASELTVGLAVNKPVYSRGLSGC